MYFLSTWGAEYWKRPLRDLGRGGISTFGFGIIFYLSAILSLSAFKLCNSDF